MTAETLWLTADEEALWRAWVDVNALLTMGLQRDLQAGSGLSMSDFDVLVHLTDHTEGQLRVTELAMRLHWERSRLSHHVARMERRGLVRRSECPEDGRGALVVVTGAGRTAIEQAAPSHVRAVRRLVFDQLDPDDVEHLARALTKLAGAGAG